MNPTYIDGPHDRPRERGAVSLIALFLAISTAGLAVGVLQSGLASRKTLRREEGSFRALEAAETGFARAEQEISSKIDSGTDGIGNLTGTYAGSSFVITATQDPVLKDQWKLLARGTSGLSTRNIEELVRRRPNGMFEYSLLSRKDLVFNGKNTTDSYDSRLGTYATQAVNVDAGGTYAMAGGDIGSNSGFVELNGSSVYVHGDAIPGPLHTVNESGSPTVTGDTTPRKTEIDLPPPPLADFQAALATNANGLWVGVGGTLTYDSTMKALSFKGSHATLTMPGGTYFFSTFSLSSGATVKFAGPTKIYVTGSLDLGGGTTVNATGIPADLQVFANPYALPAGFTPTTTNVKINGGADAALALYGPNADLTIGGGVGLWGAAVANHITISGDCAFHYDEALADVGLFGPAKIERLYWREPSPPRR